MKTLKSTIALITTSLLVVALIVAFPGCSKDSPMGPQLGADQDIAHLSKKPVKEAVIEPVSPDDPLAKFNYPQYGEATLKFARKYGQYFGAMLKTPNNSSFMIYNWSLTPPSGREGLPVTITMKIEMSPDQDELMFTFGPSGCQFAPEAQVIMDYSDLVISGDDDDSVPSLFLVDENGNYIPEDEQNYKVDIFNKWIYLYVPHFSRYSLIRR